MAELLKQAGLQLEELEEKAKNEKELPLMEVIYLVDLYNDFLTYLESEKRRTYTNNSVGVTQESLKSSFDEIGTMMQKATMTRDELEKCIISRAPKENEVKRYNEELKQVQSQHQDQDQKDTPPSSAPSSSSTNKMDKKSTTTVKNGTFKYVEETATEALIPRKSKITYWNYIKPRELTSLVEPRSSHHDEHLFIITHQHFEVWFKQILYELETVSKLLRDYSYSLEHHYNFDHSNPNQKIDFEISQNTKLIKAVQYLKRADKIVRYSIGGFEILETMDPSDFLDFREHLGDGSGFQSTQFRELEILLGVTKRPTVHTTHSGLTSWETKFLSDGCPFSHQQQIQKRKNAPSLLSTLYSYLSSLLPTIPHLDAFISHVIETKKRLLIENLSANNKNNNTNNEADRKKVEEMESEVKKFFYGSEGKKEKSEKKKELYRVRRVALWLFTWRDHPSWYWKYEVVNGMVAFEQGFVVWRQRHPRMVEVMIGRRVGTGGSSGVAYLDSTTLPVYRVFPDLSRGDDWKKSRNGRQFRSGVFG
eukprot:TRINITY_DN3548_c0_g1_i2.p1 TRINITY_DN3548_c0_g1~~TRINITY_DN3548_c0_g1_i2.p1  ORF type:complete len:535 (+),score=158.89 TRINITY_DN3548_c0_g1_i2:65-1669(+)